MLLIDLGWATEHPSLHVPLLLLIYNADLYLYRLRSHPDYTFE